jgi:hypothetical protein
MKADYRMRQPSQIVDALGYTQKLEDYEAASFLEGFFGLAPIAGEGPATARNIARLNGALERYRENEADKAKALLRHS